MKIIPVSKAVYFNLMLLDLRYTLAFVLGLCKGVTIPSIQAQNKHTRQETLKKYLSWSGRCPVYFNTPI